MSAQIKYAYKHRQTWLYRRNYPKDLQPILGQALKQSLRTGDARVAKARVAEANTAYDQIIAAADQQIKGTSAESIVQAPCARFRRIRLSGRETVAELAKTYLGVRAKGLQPSTYKAVRYGLGLFVSVFGSRQIASLDSRDGADYLQRISLLCPNVAKAAGAKGDSLTQLIKRSQATSQRITPQTQQRIWKQVRHFMDWCVATGHLEQHDFGRLNVDRKPEVLSYAVPTEAELTALISAKEPVITPLLYLCLLTGLRSGEACGLMADDLTTKGNLGVFVNVRPNSQRLLKSKAAEREVPLHDQLLPIVQALPSHGPLFPSVNADKVTKRFTRLRGRLGLTGPGLVFHSTRKWFITQCERTGVPEHFTASLVGHQTARSENKLTYGLYSAGISDSQKRQIVDQVRLPESCLP
ncbi:DUF6538 domain-containing protein [Primorskyibacter sp. 2E233]|uniref:DUF6538 domain-containing protein n=1 Tax=Primorskyibacter sp. 2E233 TaxID=3413431 RepID=UPI003BF157B9